MASVGKLRFIPPNMRRETDSTSKILTTVEVANYQCNETLKSAYEETLKMGSPVVVSSIRSEIRRRSSYRSQ